MTIPNVQLLGTALWMPHYSVLYLRNWLYIVKVRHILIDPIGTNV